MILYFLIIILTLFLIFVFGLFAAYLVYTTGEGRIGYVGSHIPTLRPVLKKIINQYIPPREVVKTEFVELGSGLALVSQEVCQNFQFQKIVAIEGDFTLSNLARFYNFCFKKSKIYFLRQDVWGFQPVSGSLLYLYLSSKIVTRLYQEGRLDNCLVVCLSFEIQGIKPAQIIELPNFQKRILVYDFRSS